MHDFGKPLVVVGLIIVGVGLFVYLGGRVPWLGNLPLDIDIKTERFRLYFPLGTCLLLSGLLSLLFYLWRR